MTVSNLIQELRESRQMTRPQLARHARISRAHLWAVENQLTMPGIPTLQRLSDAFGVGVARLLSTTEHEMLLEDSFIQKIHPLLWHLNDDHKSEIINMFLAALLQKRR